jgi:hypothetical protein
VGHHGQDYRSGSAGFGGGAGDRRGGSLGRERGRGRSLNEHGSGTDPGEDVRRRYNGRGLSTRSVGEPGVYPGGAYDREFGNRRRREKESLRGAHRTLGRRNGDCLPARTGGCGGLDVWFWAILPAGPGWLRGIAARPAARSFRAGTGAPRGGDFPTPLLLANGLYDSRVPRRSALRLAEAAPPPMRQIWLLHGHLMPDDFGAMRERADSTIRYFPFLRSSASEPIPLRSPAERLR